MAVDALRGGSHLYTDVSSLHVYGSKHELWISDPDPRTNVRLVHDWIRPPGGPVDSNASLTLSLNPTAEDSMKIAAVGWALRRHPFTDEFREDSLVVNTYNTPETEPLPSTATSQGVCRTWVGREEERGSNQATEGSNANDTGGDQVRARNILFLAYGLRFKERNEQRTATLYDADNVLQVNFEDGVFL